MPGGQGHPPPVAVDGLGGQFALPRYRRAAVQLGLFSGATLAPLTIGALSTTLGVSAAVLVAAAATLTGALAIEGGALRLRNRPLASRRPQRRAGTSARSARETDQRNGTGTATGIHYG
ncbi:hypothetical protein GCM10023322_58110 [Rugosimonospora acidiphila]|uniref:MFS transporter n=1 Tax=Rugosimonospora acidiphila TaxID=556531 RepID=A0ABP9SEI5_9ACTN